jgi:hypothetical protein
MRTTLVFRTALVFLSCVSAASVARAERRPSMLADHAPGAPPAVLELDLGLYVDSSDAGTTVVGFPSDPDSDSESEVRGPSPRWIQRSEIRGSR